MSYLSIASTIFFFCLEIPNCFIIGAEPAYHGRITVEMTSNFNGFHATPSYAPRMQVVPGALPRRAVRLDDT